MLRSWLTCHSAVEGLSDERVDLGFASAQAGAIVFAALLRTVVDGVLGVEGDARTEEVGGGLVPVGGVITRTWPSRARGSWSACPAGSSPEPPSWPHFGIRRVKLDVSRIALLERCVSATRSASPIFWGFRSSKSGLTWASADVGLPNGVRGPVVARKRLPLIARWLAAGSKSSGDVGS